MKNFIGKDIITASGNTLLGADDKAGVAIIMSFAQYLINHPEILHGTIKLLFQPAEEKAPGGASVMIQDGALQNPVPSGILGQHVAPNIPVGKIGFREGT